MTGLLLWLAVGSLVGVLARQLLPGPRGSWIVVLTTAVGCSVAGGLLATLMDMGGVAEHDVRSLVLAGLTALLGVLFLQLLRVWRT